MADPSVVNIVVHGDEITVSPTVLKAAANSVVEWRAPGVESFVLVFRDGAAVAVEGFGTGVEVTSRKEKVDVEPWIAQLLHEKVGDHVPVASALPAERKASDHVPVARATLQRCLGVHPYQLAVAKATTDADGKVSVKLYLDAGCPEVIIQ